MSALNVTLGVTRDVAAVTRTTPGGRAIPVRPAIIGGDAVTFDLRKGPHTLISGTTGSGKSVAIHAMLTDLLRDYGPDHLGLVLVDPKRVELGDYAHLPHLTGPNGQGAVHTEPADMFRALGWVLSQVEARFTLMQQHGVKDIAQLDADVLAEADQPRFLVMVVDELADLVMAAKGLSKADLIALAKHGLSDVEVTLARILQVGRAAGVHCVLATQRPSSDIVTGVIKANVPSRLVFALQNATDSRVAMGQRGAEELEGKGDALWLPTGARTPLRMQGRFVQPEEQVEVLAGVRAWQASYEAWASEHGQDRRQTTESDGQLPSATPKLWDLSDVALPEAPSGSGKDGALSKRQARIHNRRVRQRSAWNTSGRADRIASSLLTYVLVATLLAFWFVGTYRAMTL